jgi:hypothetical protein
MRRFYDDIGSCLRKTLLPVREHSHFLKPKKRKKSTVCVYAINETR